jgi:uncharacterized membrane protein YbhN (UPF0104 family)
LVLWREFHQVSFAEVTAAMRAWGPEAVVLALVLSASSFLLMGIVEWMGLRWAGAKVPLLSALAGSFMASGIAHTLGANMLVSAAVRARVYTRFNVSLRQVAAATVFDSFAFAAGISTLAGLGLVLAPHREIAATRFSDAFADSLGVLLLAGVAAYVLLCAFRRRPLSAFGHSVHLPSFRIALAQMGLGAVDNAVAAGILYVLLPKGPVGYFSFTGAYAPSVVAGLVSHVPGGVGVFEGSLSALLAQMPPAPLAAAFLGYRLAFFVLPLILATLALSANTLMRHARS